MGRGMYRAGEVRGGLITRGLHNGGVWMSLEVVLVPSIGLLLAIGVYFL